jgi:mannose-6-phosphate isomerase-like protein (cupin superfamily)
MAGDALAGTAMAGRLVRYADLVPCRTAFIDTRTPGSTEKENFTIIGPGVSESPDQFVHIAQPHGFNIGGARQPFGCVNSQHSHETAEVFVVHSGHWRLLFGPNCEDGSLEIGPGDVASVPTQMFRGFEKVDEGTGFLWVALGQDEPGKVTWAPAVLEAAQDFGLKLTKGGQLIDTSSGDYELRDVELETGLDAEAAAQLRTPPLEKLLNAWCAPGRRPPIPTRRWPRRGGGSGHHRASGHQRRLCAGADFGLVAAWFQPASAYLADRRLCAAACPRRGRGDLHPVRHAGGQLGRWQPDHGRR